MSPAGNSGMFDEAEMYDLSINWSARLEREIPVLTDVLGPPGSGGIIDAGCGTGRQARALAERSYRVVGIDASTEMLEVARRAKPERPADVRFVKGTYAELYDAVGGGFDGLYCLANALAAAGSAARVAEAVERFGRCLRAGGRLFIQILNFEPMRAETPCVRGPRIVTVDGREYVSVRHFRFIDDRAEVTNVTLWNDDGWHQRAHTGTLYPVGLDELRSLLDKARLRVDHLWGSYGREPFEVESSVDLIVIATRL